MRMHKLSSRKLSETPIQYLEYAESWLASLLSEENDHHVIKIKDKHSRLLLPLFWWFSFVEYRSIQTD